LRSRRAIELRVSVLTLGKIMKALKIAGILLLLSHLSYAGDVHYFSIGTWGVGEISNRLLIYHGDTSYQTFIPVSKAWVAVYAVFITAILLAYTTFNIRLRKK